MEITVNVEGMIENALITLTKDRTFYITQIDFNKENFGNYHVVLSSHNRVGIRFIRDRGIFWCELGRDEKWYFIEDVFNLIGVTITNKNNDFIDFIVEMATLIQKNIPQIFLVLSEKNFRDTQINIKALATKRAMEMFKQD